MTPPHLPRLQRVLDEIKGVKAQYGVTDWEFQRLTEWCGTWRLTPKQEKIVEQIETKVFGGNE